MKIIISPAKKMTMEHDFLEHSAFPVFLEKAEVLKEYLKGLDYETLKKVLKCNDQIAVLNYERYQRMDLKKHLNPAILSYDGIQYQYMAPQVFEDRYFAYIQEHVRILSGFYGILKPFDGVTPYRLEMQAQIPLLGTLYHYWGDSIYKELTQEDNLILNLASNEYARTVKKYLQPHIKMVTCRFGEFIDGKVREKGVYVKMARGEMVRFMAEYQVQDIRDIQLFDRLCFQFTPELSDGSNYVFIKKDN